MAYPRPKQVRHKPSTEINPSIVNIRFSPPFPDSVSGFYVIEGSQSLRRGLTAYHLGQSQINATIIKQEVQFIFSLYDIRTGQHSKCAVPCWAVTHNLLFSIRPSTRSQDIFLPDSAAAIHILRPMYLHSQETAHPWPFYNPPPKDGSPDCSEN